jgi:hypothetical protein
MKKLDEELLKSLKNETFLDVISDSYLENFDNNGGLIKLLASMHNEGLLDVIYEFRKLNITDKNRNFLLLTGVLGEILPAINASVSQVMSCVRHLTMEADDNMAAQTLMRPFMGFCLASQQRPSAILSLATETVDEEFDFISPAIISGSKINLLDYVEKAKGLAQSESSTLSRRAVLALGKIDYQNNKGLIKVALEIVISASYKHGGRQDSRFFSISLKSLVLLFKQDENCKSILLSFMQNHEEEADDQLIHTAAEILFSESGKIPDDIEMVLLELACKVKKESQNTIRNLDQAFSHILKRGEFNKVIVYLETLFEQSNYEIPVSAFDSTVRELFKNKDTYLSKLVTRWLLSRNSALCRCCSDLVDNNRDKKLAIKSDLSQLSGDHSNAHLFLARKACGWLFFRQPASVSFIASLIDSAPEEQLEEIASIVFNPLLINYPGSVKKYLTSLPDGASEKLQGFVSSVLIKLDEYHKGLEGTSEINEMKPSESQRHAYSRLHKKKMSKFHDGVREGSFFLSMIKESVLLYGNSSIHYMHHSSGKSRQESQMHEVSTSIEFPSLQYIDPHGLDHLIRRFRLEGCTK